MENNVWPITIALQCQIRKSKVTKKIYGRGIWIYIFKWNKRGNPSKHTSVWSKLTSVQYFSSVCSSFVVRSLALFFLRPEMEWKQHTVDRQKFIALYRTKPNQPTLPLLVLFEEYQMGKKIDWQQPNINTIHTCTNTT